MTNRESSEETMRIILDQAEQIKSPTLEARYPNPETFCRGSIVVQHVSIHLFDPKPGSKLCTVIRLVENRVVNCHRSFRSPQRAKSMGVTHKRVCQRALRIFLDYVENLFWHFEKVLHLEPRSHSRTRRS